MSKTGNLTIVLHAGGESRRMGCSKATVPFLGEPLIMRGIHRLMPMADEFIITTNEPENLGFLDNFIRDGTLRLVTDICEKRGALRGIYSGMNAANKEFVALVACDMIFPSRKLIAAELAALIDDGHDLAVPVTKFGYEPFHGVYRRATCLPIIRQAVDEGEVRASAWFNKVDVTEFDAKRVAAAEPLDACFININTPEELANTERKILEGAYHEHDGCGDDR